MATRRGLRRVKMAISDAHESLKAAATKVLNATSYGCRIHFLKNALANVGPVQPGMVGALLKTLFVQRPRMRRASIGEKLPTSSAIASRGSPRPWTTPKTTSSFT